MHIRDISFQDMKKIKKLELLKNSIVELSKDSSRVLKGSAGCSTSPHSTHVNTCFTYNCCGSQGCSYK